MPHPAQFPLAVVERIIRASSNPGDVVLDPFLGSGSLIEGAIRTGRIGVGFEINPKYVGMAANRIKKAAARQSQSTLF
jgi:adenine-specific DNA-methyltransferase